MSMNRTTYDKCVYEQELNQSVSPLAYVMDPIQFNNCNKCRMELGVVGGTAVSHIAGNLVDLENDLRGQTRPSAQCPAYKYLPVGRGEQVQGREFIKPVEHPAIDTTPVHLPPCQMINYGAVPGQPEVKVDRCPGIH